MVDRVKKINLSKLMGLRTGIQMKWYSVSVLALLSWVFSFCTIFGVYQIPSEPLFLGKETRNVLLVIAHPDDESMFFFPTIEYLTSQGHNVSILCLSIGNADGKGNTRRKELLDACLFLGISPHQVEVIDHPALQDGFDKSWSHQLLRKIIEYEIEESYTNLLITFDKYGVSGHRNHRDLYQGIRLYLHHSPKAPEAWELISTNIIRKYIGPVDVWLTFLSNHKFQRRDACFFINAHPWKVASVMAQHASQWTWFRKLFVMLSRYTYINTFKRINF